MRWLPAFPGVVRAAARSLLRGEVGARFATSSTAAAAAAASSSSSSSSSQRQHHDTGNASSAANTEHAISTDQLSASMSAFVRMEARLAQSSQSQGGDTSSSQPETATPAAVAKEAPAPSDLVEPTPPAHEDCCGNQCSNCVWLDYADKVVAYESAVSARKG